ncbi:MAG: cardiolipin synthase [Lachnospiraceae bacterium]|nr:cardiolipin synthase [Lachnospiraceae bacterium]
MENEKVARLGKPVRKGLLGFVFSRFFLIVLLLIAEILLLAILHRWFLDKLPVLLYLQYVFTFVMVIYLLNNSMDSSAKLTWLLVISIVPVPGTILLLLTQKNIGHRMETRMVRDQIRLSAGMIPQPAGVTEEAGKDLSGTDDLCLYLNRSGTFPLYDRTRVTYFPLGEDKFEAMLRELEKAEKFIFLEYFIVEEGYMWGRVLDILMRKAKEGVEVRMMYDGMCEISTLPPGYWKLLEKEGIHAKAFSVLKPVVSSHYNYRDHRKILVIDGRTAFTGGVNLADEYINRKERFGHWKDTAIMLEGPAIKSFTLMFLQMWNVGQKEPDYASWLKYEGEPVPEAGGYVMPFCDCPLDEYKAGEAVYMDILNRATDYVHIMTPYLILDGELEASLKFAAQRGVDVKLILPGIPDKKLAYALAKRHYRSLYDAGVKIYEYTPGFVHAKVFTCDGTKAVVGTINLDYRSLYHHFECAAYLYKTDCIKDIEADFSETLSKCREVTDDSIRHEKLSMKLAGCLAKAFAPLM